MKMLKKSLCVLLSVIMIFSCMSLSLVSFAAQQDLSSTYRSLAYSFFSYKNTGTGSVQNWVVNTDKNGYPVRSIVGKMDHYDLSSTSDRYVYADEKEEPIRSIAYKNVVTAKDNSANNIRSAAAYYLSLVDNLISYEYGVGLYTIPMIIEEVANNLRYTKADDGSYLFLDGYAYAEDATGEIVDRSPSPTYEVVDGKVEILPETEEYLAWFAQYDSDAYNLVTLFEYLNVTTVLGYFSGNCTTVNSGNWFHSFIFNCQTDEETVLIEEGDALQNRSLSIRHMTVEWKMKRQYDESGTEAQYYNGGYTSDTSNVTTSDVRQQLTLLKDAFNNYFTTYYAEGKLDNTTNYDIHNSYYTDIRRYHSTFESISDNAILAVFGQSAFNYMNLIVQLTPILNPEKPANPMYWPSHEYENYQDDNGNNVVYQVEAQTVLSIVSSIDDLLKSERVGSILKLFFNYTDPMYENMAYYYDAQNAKTAQDYLKVLIADMLYTDEIVNMILSALYPMVANLLDENLNEAMLNDLLGESLKNVIYGLLDEGDGVQSLVYAAISNIGVALTPAGVAWVWDKYGYLNDQYGYTTTFPNFRNIHAHLKAAQGGGYYKVADHSMTASQGNYYGIGGENDAYCGDRWKYVDFSQIEWGINGDRDKFLMALDAVLAPLAPLLAVLLGDSDCTIKVTDVLATPLYLILNSDKSTLNLYNKVLLPLFETLGVTGLPSGAQFEALADGIRADSNRNPDSISAFLNDGLLTPLLNWVNDDVLADPITFVLNLLPNVSYYLTSGALLGSLNGIKVPIVISHAVVFGADISVYTLDVMDLIGTDTVAFLDSLAGILTLIGLGVDTGIPIIGYREQNGTMVYRPGHPSYNPEVHTVPVKEGYVSSAGDINIYQNSEYTTPVSGLDENGEYTNYIVCTDLGWANAAGKVIDQWTTAEEEAEYTVRVQAYYEYSVYDEEADITTVYKVTNLDMVPAEKVEAGEYSFVRNVLTYEEEATLPSLMEYKLQNIGRVMTVSSGRYGTFSMTNKNGTGDTWAAGQRKCIVLTQTIMDTRYDPPVEKEIQTDGLVLLWLFRYLFSAVMYRQYDASTQDFTSEYTLLNAFGLDNETLTNELFAGLSIQSIINTVALHPDEAIAALFELFYKGEFGSLYQVVDGLVVQGQDYTYDIEYIEYHADEIMAYAEEHNDYSYGTNVLYNENWTKEKASYMVDNLDDIVDNVFKMLKLEGMDTIGQYLEGLIGDLLFTNDMLSTIANALYGLLSGIGGDIDILGILDSALDVKISKQALADGLAYMYHGTELITKTGSYTDELGNEVTTNSVYNVLITDIRRIEQYEQTATSALSSRDYDTYYEYTALAAEERMFTDNTFYQITTTIDPETGEDVEATMYSFDWGYNNPEIRAKYTDAQIFMNGLSAIASPFALIFRMLFAGEDLSVLGLINIPFYEMYQYAWIPFMEALGATDGLVDFKTYFTKCFAGESQTAMNCDTIYYVISPLFNFVDAVIANPIEIVLEIIPNLLFLISIGGLNDILNNILHFAYVLLDVLKPIVNAYDIVDSLLANIRIGDFALNISLPLDFDFNQLINQLLDGLLGENLAFDIENKNIILGYEEVEKEFFEPVLDEFGNEQYDEEGNLITTSYWETVQEEVYAVGTLAIKLPYIDFTTLCAGTVQEKMSIAGIKYIYLNSAGGADLITLLFRIVLDTLFFDENAVNIANFLIGFCQLDDEENNDEMLMEIFVYLNAEAKEAQVPDFILNLIYTVYTLLVPIAGELGTRFEYVDFSITDLFDGFSDGTLMDKVSALLNAGESSGPLSGFGRLIELIKQFFAKLKAFFEGLFGMNKEA